MNPKDNNYITCLSNSSFADVTMEERVSKHDDGQEELLPIEHIYVRYDGINGLLET